MCLSTQFDDKKSAHTRKTLKHDSSHAITLTMFYHNRKSVILKVLGVVVYCFIEKYVSVNYFCLKR